MKEYVKVQFIHIKGHAGNQYNELTGGFDSDTWCLISYGKHAGTTFIKNFYEIYDSVK